MMLTGLIKKSATPGYWYAECDVIGAATQGASRDEAAANLADAIEVKIGRKGFRVRVVWLDAQAVLIESDEPGVLVAEVLKHQRMQHGLSLADVAAKLQTPSRNAYAQYERGEREPSVAKLQELLGAVAPTLSLAFVEKPAKRKAARKERT